MVRAQASESEIRKLHSRLEGTEQRQQQMMAFLAKAVNNPGFLQQLLSARQPQQRLAGVKGAGAAAGLPCIGLVCLFLALRCAVPYNCGR